MDEEFHVDLPHEPSEPKKGRRSQTDKEPATFVKRVSSLLGTDIGSNTNVNSNAKTGWDVEEKKKRRPTTTNDGDIDDSQKKTVVGLEDEVMVVIPDLLDAGGEEDITTTIAAAPVQRQFSLPRSIGELESELSNESLSVRPINIAGLDLSILVGDSLCTMEQLEEPDIAWDWDIIFSQVSSTLKVN
ncbi:hypothetical protein HDV06_000087 [Boothiomyces sp. JEL0866]|nr:hypothetical protein HDV06_000087 [Boothiomyces sp. JEL0866]